MIAQKKGLLSDWLSKKRMMVIKKYVGGDILELGCGSAFLLRFARKRIKSYTGVEYLKESVNQLKKMYPKANFVSKDLDESKLNFKRKFDRIFLLAVIEHVYNQKHLFKELLKNLKPGGKIVLTTPTPFGNDIVHRLGSMVGLFSKEGGSDDHIVIYNKKRFEILAKDFNLKIEKYSTFQLGCNQLVVLKKR